MMPFMDHSLGDAVGSATTQKSKPLQYFPDIQLFAYAHNTAGVRGLSIMSTKGG
jgi:hypothetical protein